MLNLFIVFIGSGVGGLARFGIYSAMVHFSYHSWAGTVICNLIGSLLISIIATILMRLDAGTVKYMQPLMMVGFLGGFTTFSTFSIDTIKLLQENIQIGLFYVILNVVGSILMCFLGFKIGEAF